jgi:hypothetical protein
MEAFVATYDGTNWKAQTVGATRNTGNDAEINAISCTSATFCLAVGEFADQPGGAGTQALAVVYNGTTWTASTVAAKKNTGDSARFFSVSCATGQTFCVAGGSYRDSSGLQAIASTYNSGTWSTKALEKGENSGNIAAITAVSCVASNFCAAGGYYTSSGTQFAFASLWNGENWTSDTLDAAKTSGKTSTVGGISCASESLCTLVGGVSTSNSYEQAFAAVYDGLGWSYRLIGTKLNTDNNGRLDDVSCTGTLCTAVGRYEDTNTGVQALAAVYNGSSWQTSSVATKLNTGGDAELESVSCPTLDNCVATGFYRTIDANTNGLGAEYSVNTP